MQDRFEGPDRSATEEEIFSETLVITTESAYVHSFGDLEELFPPLELLEDEI